MSRLDVAMFNAILRESAEEMPTDPVSDPIADSKVLPVPSGRSSFGAGAQLKNAVSIITSLWWLCIVLSIYRHAGKIVLWGNLILLQVEVIEPVMRFSLSVSHKN